jgi:hypothetical protein
MNTMNTTNVSNNSVNNTIKRYILLEDKICYDWDDYEVWGAVLYDRETNEVFTSQYGHGTDLAYRNECYTLEEALANGFNGEQDIRSTMVENLGITFDTLDLVALACKHNENRPMAIPVTIVRGRKAKGKKGMLVYGKCKRNYYGWGRYHEVYDEYAYVLENGTNNVHKVNSFSYLEIDSDFVKRYNNRLKEVLRSEGNTYSLAHIYAYAMSYSACDRDNKRIAMSKQSAKAMELYKASEEIIQALQSYQDELERIAKEKREALKKEVLPNIIEWVKQNTDKQGEDIIKLAEHIFNKRY